MPDRQSGQSPPPSGTPPRPNKTFRSYRLSTDAYDLAGALAAKLGLDRTAIIEMAIRKLAESEAVKVGVPLPGAHLPPVPLPGAGKKAKKSR